MSNRIISYSSMGKDLKNAFKNWLKLTDRELVSFPFKGNHVKGYLFDYQKCKYLIVMYLKNDPSIEIDMADFNEEF
ncbi:MAG: hypothetical protein ACI857_001212 [Arenicella sp.]|jgi:hypothetical protein